MSIKIALAGNPNCGKTTMFNDLTGSSQYVGNWPGVTVEKKEGKLKGNKEVIITDLPGVYSLSPYTLEEVVSRNYLLQDKPDAILNLVDGTNLERNLYLTTQIVELGIPVVVALNMMDLVAKNGDKIDAQKLAEELGCEVVETTALKGNGSKEAVLRAVELGKANKAMSPRHTFGAEVEKALEAIAEIVKPLVLPEQLRWYAVKLFERDEKVLESMELSVDQKNEIEAMVTAVEQEMDDDSESIITNARYEYIGGVVQRCMKKKQRAMTLSDKIDRVVTNRFAALPIFVVVMTLVYYISVTSVGTILTDWANDGLFGDGWYLLGIGRGEYEEATSEYEKEQAKIEAFLTAAEEEGIDTAAMSEALAFDSEEYETEAEAAAASVISNFLTEPALASLTAEAKMEDEESGEVIALGTVNLTGFRAALESEEPDPANYGIWVLGIPVLIEMGLNAIGAADWVSSLVLDGIIAGVGSVLGFVPQMLVLFFLLSILEDCGYMARIAFIMDRIFRRFGLSGKSFIPMLIGSGCSVPGIMASKTIENEKDRRMTIMTTSFIPCGAKLPIIALIGGAIFPNITFMAPLMYFAGIAAVLFSGVVLKKTKMFRGDPAPFVMELPQYHFPAPKGVLIHMWERGKAFIVKAGTVIFVACAVIWFLSSFGWADGSFGMVEINDSILAAIGNFIAPVFAPLGFGDWRPAVATVTGLVAKENVVGTFGVLFGLGEVAEGDAGLLTQISALFGYSAAAVSFLMFNLLCAPCFAAIGAIRREMASAKWTAFALAYQTVLAYAVALIINQLGGLIFGGVTFGVGTVAAIILLAVMLFLLFRPDSGKRRKVTEKATV